MKKHFQNPNQERLLPEPTQAVSILKPNEAMAVVVVTMVMISTPL